MLVRRNGQLAGTYLYDLREVCIAMASMIWQLDASRHPRYQSFRLFKILLKRVFWVETHSRCANLPKVLRPKETW